MEYTFEEILQIAQDKFNNNKDNFLTNRNCKKIREELIYVALFSKGQSKYFDKEYKIESSENPDCILIDQKNKKNRIGFEVMVLNDYNLQGKDYDWEKIGDYVYKIKGLKNYGKNCYLLIPIIKQTKININLVDFRKSIMKHKNKPRGFTYKDIFIIIWENQTSLRVISLYKDFKEKNYNI